MVPYDKMDKKTQAKIYFVGCHFTGYRIGFWAACDVPYVGNT